MYGIYNGADNVLSGDETMSFALAMLCFKCLIRLH